MQVDSAIALVDLVDRNSLSLYPDSPWPFDVNHTITIAYDPIGKRLDVSIDRQAVISVNTTKIDDLHLNNALLGFTASTGGSWETVQIFNFFTIVPYIPPSQFGKYICY